MTPLRLEFDADAPQLAEQGPAAAWLRETKAPPEVRARYVADLARELAGREKLAATALIASAVRP